MYCADCGTEIAEAAKFCGKCGAKAEIGATAPDVNSQPLLPKGEPTQPSVWEKWGPFGGVAIIGILIVGFAMNVTKRPDTVSQTAPSVVAPTPTARAPTVAQAAPTTAWWQQGLIYAHYRDGSCSGSGGNTCVSAEQARELCKAAVSVTKSAIVLLGVTAYGDEKVLLEGGTIGDVNIFWGTSSRGVEGCGINLSLRGMVNGNSAGKTISGHASVFAVNDRNQVLVHYIDRF